MSEFVGTLRLLRLAWRRDRWIVVVVAVVLAALTYSTMKATLDLYPGGSVTAVDVLDDNPSILAAYGPLPTRTVEGLGVLKTVMMCALAAAFLAFALVRRHTRTEEETGRHEVLMAGVVGRRAPLAAAGLVAVIAVVGSALGSALGLLGASTCTAGAASLGAVVVVSGLVSIGITAVAAQLSSTTRGAGGWAMGAIGVAYALRSVGDATRTEALTWMSYLGWAEKVAPYGANRWWLILPAALACLALLAVADLLLHRRDLGAGLRAPGPGPARGTIGSVWALAERLDRSALRGWAIAYLLLGLLVGSLVRSAESMTSDPGVADMLRKMSGSNGSPSDLFLGTELRFTAIGAAGFAIATVLHARTEETTGRAELVLATRVDRVRWLGSHLLQAMLGSAMLMLLLAAAAVLGAGGGIDFGSVVGAALSSVPAIWSCAAVTALLVAFLPRLAALAWAVLAVFLLLGEFGALLGLPKAVIALTPFDHVGTLPGGGLDTAGVIVVSIVTAFLLAVAAVGIRQRDIPA